MAKMSGITGTLSGKMGNAVFRVRSGQQVVAQYQPQVTNPNTAAQQVARAKFKLITQLAAIMAPAMVTLGVVTRPARQGRNPRTGFVAKNYPLITADPSAESAEKVTIPMDDLQLTESFRPLGQLIDTSEAGIVGCEINDVHADIKSVRFVVVEYLTMNGGSQAAIRSIQDVPVTDGTALLEANATAGEKLTILAYGLIPSASALAKVDFDNIHTPSDEDFISAVDLQKMVRDGEMNVTMTSGLNVTIPSA